MASFEEYIGIRYSGRQEPDRPIKGLQVFRAQGDEPPFQEHQRTSADGQWSRQSLAEYLFERLREGPSTIVGLDHAFSFPVSFLDRYKLDTWWQFLRDFEEHWPAHQTSLRDLLPGNEREGDPTEQRLTGRWGAYEPSIFRWSRSDGRDTRGRATHAGLPWLNYLRKSLDHTHFWPFDGFEVPRDWSVVAEVRHERLVGRYGREGLTEHAQQAYAICAWLQERDRNDLLAPYFSPPLAEEERAKALREGWILGVM